MSNELVQAESKQVTTVQPGPSDPGQLIQLAIQKDFDVERLRELMVLEREWKADKAKADYASAMVRFGALKKTIQHNRTGKTAGGDILHAMQEKAEYALQEREAENRYESNRLEVATIYNIRG